MSVTTPNLNGTVKISITEEKMFQMENSKERIAISKIKLLMYC